MGDDVGDEQGLSINMPRDEHVSINLPRAANPVTSNSSILRIDPALLLISLPIKLRDIQPEYVHAA